MTADAPTTAPRTAWPPHDPATRRTLPATSTPLDPARVEALMADEWRRFAEQHPGSAAHHERALGSLPLGVTSSFQHWDPHPLAITAARGAWLTDVDGRMLLDLSMGFGAMLVGHLNPAVVAAVTEAMDVGTLFVTPSPQATDVAERFQRRFGLEQLRFTNSGTEATMYAVRTARAFTQRHAIIKIEGGYHGGYDALSVSVKPDVAEAGPERAPVPVVPFDVEAGTVYVVPYNDLDRLEEILSEHAAEIAAVVMEPVLENISIVVPDAGYLAGVRQACDRHGVLLVFDEVKTGLTAGYAGASQRLGVRPDLVALAKSVGGPAPGRLRRSRRRDGGGRRQSDVALRHLQRQPAGHGRGRRGRRDLHPRRPRPRREAQQRRARPDRPGDRPLRPAGAHGRRRRQGRGDLGPMAGAHLS
jgi:glutamate-1-semialdehyde 2,1-aminomutase